MRHGIFIPARVVRIAAGIVTAAMAAVIVKELPGAWRYYKMETM
ncbi:hypothetical protein ACFYT4_20785 [Streptomyces sp. NPDC004609]